MSDDLTSVPQGDLRLLDHDVARRLLASTIPARMAWTAADGTPRMASTWFHWNGSELVMPTFLHAPHVHRPARRLAALRARPDVALTIDTDTFPPEVLTVRGRAEITEVAGIDPDYAASARRYMGVEAGNGYLTGVDQPGTRMARITVRPTWVGVVDFQTRVPGIMAG
jgi:ABC-type amino acid transport substrate-binding protein